MGKPRFVKIGVIFLSCPWKIVNAGELIEITTVRAVFGVVFSRFLKKLENLVLSSSESPCGAWGAVVSAGVFCLSKITASTSRFSSGIDEVFMC